MGSRRYLGGVGRGLLCLWVENRWPRLELGRWRLSRPSYGLRSVLSAASCMLRDPSRRDWTKVRVCVSFRCGPKASEKKARSVLHHSESSGGRPTVCVLETSPRFKNIPSFEFYAHFAHVLDRARIGRAQLSTAQVPRCQETGLSPLASKSSKTLVFLRRHRSRQKHRSRNWR